MHSLSANQQRWLIAMSVHTERRKGAPRVVFEIPIGGQMMAIDGTWRRTCTVIDVSDTGAQLCIEASASAIDEFFLMLSNYGQPVFRRCKRVWTKGDRMGVDFDKSKITDKTMKGAAFVKSPAPL
jgi:PilZ domain